MKSLVIESALISPHTETALELLDLAIENNSSSMYFPLFAYLPTVETFIFNQDKFEETKNKIYHAVKELYPDNILRIEYSNYYDVSKNPIDYSNIKNLKFDDFPIGKYILGNVHWYTKLVDLDFNIPDIRNLADILYSIGVNSYLLVKTVCRALNPNVVYVCNGRFMTQAASKYAAKSLSSDVMIHERGSALGNYLLTDDTIHKNTKIWKDINKFCSGFDYTTVATVGCRYFSNNVNKIETIWSQASRNQKLGKLPFELRGNSIVSYFVSTDAEICEDELKDWDSGLGDQRQAFLALKQCCIERKLTLVVRMHPNLHGKASDENDFWLNQASESTVIIKPDSDVDSYALAKNSAIVTTYISTMGVESLYMRMPTICLGRSSYYFIKDLMKPETVAQLGDFLDNPNVPKANFEAAMYGFYELEKGISHNHYEPDDLFTGSYKGKNLFL